MNIPPASARGSDQLKQAICGFCITMAPLAAIGCVQFLFAPQSVKLIGGMDPNVDTWAVTYFRDGLLSLYAVVALFAAGYWLITAVLGRGQIIRIRSANLILALSVLTFAFTMLVVSAIRQPERLLESTCPFFGVSTKYPFGFDAQSPCNAFATQGTATMLLGVPLILFFVSAIQRILVSRRRCQSNVR